MREDVKKFVKKCRIYQYAKGRSQNVGLYQPLQKPSHPCDVVSMDFVLRFHRTQRVHDSILVIVDIFSKMAPCFKKSDATHVENIFFQEVVRLHGLPRSIVSDRDTIFVGNFWRNLWKNMGINFIFSSAYHPQTDEQTKVTNMGKFSVNVYELEL